MTGSYPMPNAEALIDDLEHTEIFSTLDMLSGFYQIAMDPADRDKTAFITKQGLYRFTRMLFGFKNAPATFQSLMETVLAGLPFADTTTAIRIAIDANDVLIIRHAASWKQSNSLRMMSLVDETVIIIHHQRKYSYSPKSLSAWWLAEDWRACIQRFVIFYSAISVCSQTVGQLHRSNNAHARHRST